MSESKAKKAMSTQDKLSGSFTNAVRNHIDRKGTGDEIIIAALGTITATLRAISDADAKEALAQLVVKHVSIATKGEAWWQMYCDGIAAAQRSHNEAAAKAANGETLQ